MSSEKERMLAGERYDSSDAELREDRLRAVELLSTYNDVAGFDMADREETFERQQAVLEDLVGSMGDLAFVEPPFRCDYGSHIHLGERFYANKGCVFLDAAPIEFGAYCLVGPGVHVYAATHPLDPEARRAPDGNLAKPVTVGDDVWIGGRAVINPGVSIGDGAMVAAGAVVTEDVPSRTVVQGNPAEVVKELD